MAFWKCYECGRSIGDDEYTSKGRTEDDHICMGHINGFDMELPDPC